VPLDLMRRPFQLPYGGRGRSDSYDCVDCDYKEGFNHLAVAGVGQTGVHKQ